jgi:predicted acylesterase/phospholipase RssA
MLNIKSPDEIFGFAARYPRLRMVTREIRRALLDLPPEESGIYDLQQVERFVSDTLTGFAGGVPTFAELDADFRCVALDLGTGEPGVEESLKKQVFSRDTTPDVRLDEAIAASMAIPGVFPPKLIGGRYYVDGGVVEQLPVATARDEWVRAQHRFSRRQLAIIAVDLGPPSEAPTKSTLGHPVDLAVYTQRMQGRVITALELARCHNLRRKVTTVLVRPADIEIALYEVWKIPEAMYVSYVRTVRQLEGRGFLDVTNEEVATARDTFGVCKL